MNWLVIDEKYLDYLRKTERRIPFSDYGKDKYKPFFGVLFETEKFYYVTQISHPQDRHLKMKANLDFKKVYMPDSNRLLAVINLNYMFPIPKSLYQQLEYKDIDKHRSFVDDTEKSKYIDLMKTELKIINTMNIEKAALRIYENKYACPESDLAKRCIDFKLMEQLALQYEQGKENEHGTKNERRTSQISFGDND